MSLIQLLMIDSDRRTLADIKKITQHLKKTPYFLQFQRHKGDKLLKNMLEGFAKYGQLESVHEGQILQKSGEKPDRVQLLIQGSVISLQPKSEHEIQEETNNYLAQYPTLQDKLNQTIPFQIEYTAQKYIRLKAHLLSTPFNNRTRARVKSQILFSQKFDNDDQSQIPQDYLDILAKQLDNILDGTTIHKDFWVQYFFEGLCVKFKKEKTFIHGEVLGNENDYQLKKNDSFLISQTDSHLLVVHKRHFDELMKSIELDKAKKLIENVLQSFDEGIRTNDLKVLAKEIVRVSTKRKICSNQRLFQTDQQSPYIYTVLKGEFMLTKSFILDKEMNLQKVYEQTNQLSQYEQYKKYIFDEKQAQQQLQQQQQQQNSHIKTKRKKTILKQGQLDQQLIQNQELVNEIGNHNYKLLQEIIDDELKKNELNHVLQMRNKKNIQIEFNLAKIGPNQLLGEQDFTHDYHTYQANRFNITCTSSSAKVLQIKKSDLYRLCYAFDWFAQLWHTKCQNKYFWIQNRYQFHLQQFLIQHHPNGQPQQNQQYKNKDEKVLAKFSNLKQKQQDLSDKSEKSQSADKIIQAKRKVQKKYYDEQDQTLNCVLLNREENQKNYEQNLKIKLITQNIAPRENMGEVFLTSEIPRVKGYSPVKANHNIQTQRNEENSMKHKAAVKLQDAMSKTINPQLTNPVKVYISDLLQENCTIFQQNNNKEAFYDKDIGLLSYLLKLDKKQQRLLQYTIVKNMKKRSIDQSKQYSLSTSRILPKDIEKSQKESFSNYQNLLQHVTKQHFRKIADSMHEVDDMKDLPVQMRSFQKTAYSKKLLSETNKESFDGRFSQGTINSIRIRNRMSSLGNDLSAERSKILSGHMF